MRELTKRCVDWVVSTLGERIASDLRERAMRVLEEAVELAQSLGLEEYKCRAIINRVYKKPVGAAPQEAAGVYFTLIVLAHAAGFDLRDELLRELERVEDPAMRERIREKHGIKVGLGIGLPLGPPVCLACPKGFDGKHPEMERSGTGWRCQVHGWSAL